MDMCFVNENAKLNDAEIEVKDAISKSVRPGDGELIIKAEAFELI